MTTGTQHLEKCRSATPRAGWLLLSLTVFQLCVSPWCPAAPFQRPRLFSPIRRNGKGHQPCGREGMQFAQEFQNACWKEKRTKEAVVNTAPRAAEERGVGLELASA